MSESETARHCTTLTGWVNTALTGQNASTSSHSDVLAKALTVFSLPGSNRSRRLDLVFAVPEVYWTAVVGWWVLHTTAVMEAFDGSLSQDRLHHV